MKTRTQRAKRTSVEHQYESAGLAFRSAVDFGLALPTANAPNFYETTIKPSPVFESQKRVDDRQLLEPVTREAADQIIARAAELGIKLMIFETYRSKERQRALFQQGATKLREVGLHHYGLACDLVRDVNGEPSWKGDWEFLGHLARHYGLVWGGDWGRRGVKPSFFDGVHVQRVTLARQASIFAGRWYPGSDYDPYLDGAT